MNEERLTVEVRDAFADVYEPSPGLEDRVVAAIPWHEPRPRTVSKPRVAAAFAAGLAVLVVVALIAPTVLNRLGITISGSNPGTEPPAYSLAAVTPDSLFIVQRRGSNVLLQSPDGGRTWADRLHFMGVYDGMEMFGKNGFIWSIEMDLTDCTSTGCRPASQHVSLYRTWDGGATWTQLPDPGFPVSGVFFLDALHGWIDAGSPATGLGSDVLYSSSDGGKSWKLVGGLPQSAPMSWVYGVGMYHVTFSDPQRGWYLGDGLLFTSDDGGHTWKPVGGMHRLAGTTLTYSQPVFNGQDGILPIAFRDVNGPDNATANQLYFYVTHDGGATWSQAGRPAPVGFAPVGDILSITILDSQHLWLTSQSLTGGDNVQTGPAVARTADGGISWTVTHQTWRILEMTFKDATHGYALDVTGDQNVNGILSTSDAGATWHRVNVPVFS